MLQLLYGKEILTFRKIVVPPVLGSSSSKLINMDYESSRILQKVAVYQSTRRNIPEDLNFQQHYCENLETRKTSITRTVRCFTFDFGLSRISFRSLTL